MIDWRRLREGWAGFLSCVAASVIPAIVLVLVMSLHRPHAVPDDLSLLLIGVSVVAFMHSVLLGIPASLVLVQKGWFRAVPMLGAGSVVGMLPVGLLIAWQGRTPFWSWGHMEVLAASAVLGALGGVSFYFAHRWISPAKPRLPAATEQGQ